MKSKLIEQQKAVCEKYGSEYCLAPLDMTLGIALKTFGSSAMPTNGLRHPIEVSHNSSWYIWAGEYSLESDFFQTIHIQHLIDHQSTILKYLGLAPGWRFLIDDNGYEDVWFDESLLKI